MKEPTVTSPARHAVARVPGEDGSIPMPYDSGSRAESSRGRALQRFVASWITSLGLHVFLLALMFAVVFPFAPKEAEPVPPDVRLRIVGRIDAPTSSPELNADQPIESIPVEARPVQFHPSQAEALSAVLAPKRSDLQVVGIGAAGGDFDRFGLSIGGGAIPEFFGVGSTSRAAKRIVYVVDRSGSMIDTFEFVADELRRSISAMRRSQKFHVIFFNSGTPLENPPRRLVSAIQANKQEAFDFLQTVSPQGKTDPGPALARALSLEPDLVYLLSDGEDFEPELLNRLNEWNRSRATQICTVAYLNRDGRNMLERIAREHNGEFRFVSEYDLP